MRSRITPLSPQRYAIQFTMDRATHDLLRHVQALLSHQLPSGDEAQVFALALRALAARLEKQKCAATPKPKAPPTHRSSNPRHIPAHVRRAVWERDQGQCTFVSDSGQRCGARRFLQYDHACPVARGGQATIGQVRLRCRGHNQLEAERVFGAGFMDEMRRAAAEDRAAMEPRATAGT